MAGVGDIPGQVLIVFPIRRMLSTQYEHTTCNKGIDQIVKMPFKLTIDSKMKLLNWLVRVEMQFPGGYKPKG